MKSADIVAEHYRRNVCSGDRASHTGVVKKAEVIEPGKIYAPGPDRVYVNVERRNMEKAMGKLIRKKNAPVVVDSLVEVLEKFPLDSLKRLAVAVQAELLLRSGDAK